MSGWLGASLAFWGGVGMLGLAAAVQALARRRGGRYKRAMRASRRAGELAR